MWANPGMVKCIALDSLVIIVGNPHENTQIRPTLQVEHKARVLDCFPRRLEEKPLLRVDIRRFAGRNAEELRIELIDAFDESTAADDRLAGQARLRIIIPLHVPAIGWNLDHAFATLDEKSPERFRVTHAAGETAPNSNNRNTFFLHSRNWPARPTDLNAPCGCVKVGEYPSERKDVTLQVYTIFVCGPGYTSLSNFFVRHNPNPLRL